MGAFLALKWEVISSSTTLTNRFLRFLTEITAIEISVSIHWICSSASPQAIDVLGLFIFLPDGSHNCFFVHLFYVYVFQTDF